MALGKVPEEQRTLTGAEAVVQASLPLRPCDLEDTVVLEVSMLGNDAIFL